MDNNLKLRLLKLLGRHYIILAEDLKDRLINSDDDVNDLMQDYTVMLNECNELAELLRKESDAVSTDGINVTFDLAELQQTLYAVQDVSRLVDTNDYVSVCHHNILHNVEQKLKIAANGVFGTSDETQG